MIGEDAMMFEFNNHLLVREYTKKFDDGRSKMLELEWNPVLDANDQIDKLMVTVRDVTELKALQAETEKQKEELAIIGQILAVSGEKLQKFIATSNAFFEENKKLISQNTHTDLSVVATLFRNMHTIKGNARTYGLSYITDSVHNAESTYDKLRSNPDEKWDQQQLLSELELARACVARYETIYNEKLAGFGNKGASIDGSVLDDILQAVSGVDDMSSTVALQQSLLTVKSTIALAKSDSVEEVVKDIVSGLSSLATQLDKQTPVVNMNANNVRLRQNISPIIANVFMHLFRNSLDHGIESSELRLALAKSGAGTINLDVSLNQQSVVFEFSDDGRGLALEDIKTKAIELGKISADQPMTDEQIAHLIFLPGLSTAKSLTSVSGRGVGMDAIKQFLQKIDGDIDLAFTAEAAGSYRQFKLIITLPAKFALIDNKKMQQATLNAEYGG
jgi:two-component system chemotaxis sensor kinase CheA